MAELLQFLLMMREAFQWGMDLCVLGCVPGCISLCVCVCVCVCVLLTFLITLGMEPPDQQNQSENIALPLRFYVSANKCEKLIESQNQSVNVQEINLLLGQPAICTCPRHLYSGMLADTRCLDKVNHLLILACSSVSVHCIYHLVN